MPKVSLSLDDRKKIIEVYRESGGNISLACEAVGITRAVFNDFYHRDDRFRLKFNEANKWIRDSIRAANLAQHLDGKGGNTAKLDEDFQKAILRTFQSTHTSNGFNADKSYEVFGAMISYIDKFAPVSMFLANTAHRKDLMELCSVFHAVDVWELRKQSQWTPRTLWDNYVIDIVGLQESLGWDVRKIIRILSLAKKQYLIYPNGALNIYVSERIKVDAEV